MRESDWNGGEPIDFDARRAPLAHVRFRVAWPETDEPQLRSVRKWRALFAQPGTLVGSASFSDDFEIVKTKEKFAQRMTPSLRLRFG